MRIISPFHDYYDIGQQFGEDGLTYVRREEKIDARESDLPILSPSSSNFFIVVFCGIPYIGYTKLPEKEGEKLEIIYGKDEIDAHLEELHSKDKNKYLRKYWRTRRQNALIFDRTTVHVDTFIEKGMPLVVYFSEAKYHYNPLQCEGGTYRDYDCLRKLEFFKVIDPYTAYQELTMFIGNIASPETTSVGVDDKHLLRQKGFDEWSFKKLPTKRNSK